MWVLSMCLSNGEPGAIQHRNLLTESLKVGENISWRFNSCASLMAYDKTLRTKHTGTINISSALKLDYNMYSKPAECD